MMRKTLATALFALFTAAVGAAPGAIKFRSDSTEIFGIREKVQLFTDSIDIPIDEKSYMNAYHERLYALQKEVPLTYNQTVQNFINIYLDRKDQMGRMVGLSEYYFPIFEKALRAKGIPEEIKYLSIVESALDPQAVSRVGATGPWQFMYSTAKAFGLTIDNYVDERKDPIAASYAAANYFRDAYNEFGDWLLAIAAYNCGKGNVNRAIKLAGGINDYWAIWEYLPRETRNYVPAFIATTYVMSYHQQHNITPRSAHFTINTDTVAVNRFVSLSSISKAAGIDLKELKLLNPAYKKQIVNGTTSVPKRLIIPKVNGNSFASLYDVLNDVDTEQPTAYQASDPEVIRGRNPSAHKVREGETLTSIANHYQVEVQDLRVWNKLSSTLLVPGQNLRLAPERTFIIYKVQAGDTLFDISRKFEGTTALEIQQLNGLQNDNLKPGMTLKINKG